MYNMSLFLGNLVFRTGSSSGSTQKLWYHVYLLPVPHSLHFLSHQVHQFYPPNLSFIHSFLCTLSADLPRTGLCVLFPGLQQPPHCAPFRNTNPIMSLFQGVLNTLKAKFILILVLHKALFSFYLLNPTSPPSSIAT